MKKSVVQMQDIVSGYEGSTIIEDVSLTLEYGEGLALLGRNGMGKTTLLQTLMGSTQLYGGSIHFDNQDITTTPSHIRANRGLGWVPQERGIFGSLSVEENLEVARHPGPWDLAKVYAAFPRLKERRNNMGNQLSGGELQMLAMGRALMLNPKVLVMDEPLEGLAPIIAENLFAIIKELTSSSDLAFILVEQDARRILPLTSKALVLDSGKTTYYGPSEALLQKDSRLDEWLGVGAQR